MVSKIIKKTPTKTTKEWRSRRRKKYSIKTVVATINTCHRRLIKIFSKLTRICTLPKKNLHPTKQGYQIIQKIAVANNHRNSHRRSLCYSAGCNRILPPPSSLEKRTIFLDLDETLVHSKAESSEKYDFVVRPVINGVEINFYVLKRPFVDELLEFLSRKFEIVIFTAGLREYASLVLNQLDRNALISHRLYRESCREVNGKLVKDLAGLRRDLKRVVIVDDNPNAYSFQPENAIPIRPFTDDLSDDELRRLMEFLEGSDEFDDMRDAVKQYLAGEEDMKL